MLLHVNRVEEQRISWGSQVGHVIITGPGEVRCFGGLYISLWNVHEIGNLLAGIFATQ